MLLRQLIKEVDHPIQIVRVGFIPAHGFLITNLGKNTLKGGEFGPEEFLQTSRIDGLVVVMGFPPKEELDDVVNTLWCWCGLIDLRLVRHLQALRQQPQFQSAQALWDSEQLEG